jgi:maleylacetoacetate isomerase
MGIILFSYFRSSCSWRVRIALNLLGIPHQIKPVNLLKAEQDTSEYRAINPLGTVPSLQTASGDVIWQSIAIIDFLDDKRMLTPVDPMDRARCMQITQTIVSEIQPLQNLSVTKRIAQLAGEEAKTEWAVYHNHSKLKIINDNLIKDRNEFCIGNRISLADICLVPQLYSAQRFGIDIKTEFPRLYSIARKLETIDAFKRAHPHAQPDCPSEIKALGVFFNV